MEQYIEWLEKRIEQTQKEKDDSESLEIKVSKGCKLTAYKETLNYIKTHQVLRSLNYMELETELNKLPQKEEELILELRRASQLLFDEYRDKMEVLEARIEKALEEEISDDTKEITGYYRVEDVTQSIQLD